ncbi:MAG: sigma-70 family RNA polymerase sigma factor [Herpetosiphonaceae bacterium]|nr:sigma-70 family RNA polymerase sigma factor [Herpetosiphonaceae bacterium]
MQTDEAALIVDAQHGDVRPFNLLVERYQTRLYSLSYRVLNDHEAAADVTQETFISAFRKLKSFRGGSFSAWLLRIATNGCYDYLRARQRKPQTSLDAFDPDSDDQPRQFTAQGEAPDERVLRTELGEALQRALAELPDDQRLVVVLSDVQGLSYEEMAQATGWPLGSVKSRLSRGRAALREILRRGELLPERYRLIRND